MTTHWADIDLLSVSSLEAPVFKREWFTKAADQYSIDQMMYVWDDQSF